MSLAGRVHTRVTKGGNDGEMTRILQVRELVHDRTRTKIGCGDARLLTRGTSLLNSGLNDDWTFHISPQKQNLDICCLCR